MSEPITKPLLGDVVETAARNAAHLPPSELPKQVKAAVLSDPTIARSTKPIAAVSSQVYQGASIPVLASAGVIVAKWFGYQVDVQDVIVVFTAASIVGALIVDYGRRNGSRPIGGLFSTK